MILFFLIFFSLSNSDEEEDLYEILGVSRHASEAEITKAFKSLVKQYHPDRNPTPEAERKLMKINNAYEILKNPKTRRLYDRTGSSDFQEFDQYQNFYDFQQFQSTTQETPNSNINPITYEEFQTKVEQMDKDIFILFYSNHDDAKSEIASLNFASTEFAGLFDFYYHLVKHHSREFLEEFNIPSTPALIYIERENRQDSQYKFTIYPIEFVLTPHAFKFFVRNHFSNKIQQFKTFEKVKNWAVNFDGRTKFLILERSTHPSNTAKNLANQFGHMADFAILSSDYITLIREFQLTYLPKLFIFRGCNNNLTFNQYISVSSLTEETIYEYSKPLFSKFDNRSAVHECSEYCIVRIGDQPSESIMNQYKGITEYGFAYLPENTTLARAMHAKEGELYIIEGLNRKYARISNPKKISDTIAKWNLHKLSMNDMPMDVNADQTLFGKFVYLYESVKLPTILRLYISYVICVVDIGFGIIRDHTILVMSIYSVITFVFSVIWKLIRFFCCCCCFCCRPKKSKKQCKTETKKKEE